MLKNKLSVLAMAVLLTAGNVQAEEAMITGNVASKCSINVDTAGIYGNPSPSVLSTAPVDGGASPIIRFDVVNANAYKAVITTPIEFLSSPSLTDSVAWTGSVEVSSVTDPAMSSYDTDKREFNNVTEFDLSVAGIVWFKANSKAEYGYNKSLPGGTYKAMVVAECIAL